MKNRIIKCIFILIGLLILIGLIGLLVFYIRGGKVEKGVFNQFSYTVYEDRVVLNKYLGNAEEVEIPERLWGRPVVNIGYACFEKNETLRKVVIPDSVLYISNSAFLECYNLEEIIGGRSVIFIETNAFNSCEKLYNIGETGEKVEEICVQAFENCKSLTYFPMTDNLKIIDAAAFRDSGIREVDEAYNLEYIASDIFDNTPWLMAQKEEYVIYSGYLIDYRGTEVRAVIPEGVKGICVQNFGENQNLREIYIPSTVKFLIPFCFWLCRDVTVYIPKGVEKFGYVCGGTEIINGERVKYERGRESIGELFIDTESNNTIVTTAGSPAEAYAKEMGYKYEIVEGW